MWRALPDRLRLTKTLLPILAAVLMAGCGARSGPWSDIAPLPASSPHPIAGASSVDLLPIATRLRKDSSIGSYSRNVGCWVYVRTLTPADFPSPDALTAAAGQAFKTSGIAAVTGRAAALRVRGTVLRADIDACNNSFFNTGPYEINAQLYVSWKVDGPNGQTIYNGAVTGIGHVRRPDMDLRAAAAAAISDAVWRLLQMSAVEHGLTNAGYAAPTAIPTATPQPANPPPAAPPSPAMAPILIPLSAPDSAWHAGATVATGAGVYLSDSGYLLTASVNLGGASAMMVQPGGSAQLVRADADLGVALLKTASGHGGSIRQRPLVTGEALHDANGTALHLRGPADALGRLPLASANATMGAAALDKDGAIAGVVVAGPSGPLVAPIGLVFQHLNLGLSLGPH